MALEPGHLVWASNHPKGVTSCRSLDHGDSDSKRISLTYFSSIVIKHLINNILYTLGAFNVLDTAQGVLLMLSTLKPQVIL